MSRYRSRAGLVEAVPFDGSAMGAAMLARAMGEAVTVHPVPGAADGVVIAQLGGQPVRRGDWLVRDAAGAVRVVPPFAFANLYVAA